jgi:hypothetical protein
MLALDLLESGQGFVPAMAVEQVGAAIIKLFDRLIDILDVFARAMAAASAGGCPARQNDERKRACKVLLSRNQPGLSLLRVVAARRPPGTPLIQDKMQLAKRLRLLWE